MASHCPQCGARAEAGDRFCRQCGFSLHADDRFSADMGETENVSPRPALTSQGSLREKLTSPVRLGWTFVPLYAAIIIGLLATAGVAYAALAFYENVTEPAITQSQQQGEASSEETEEGSAESNEASAENQADDLPKSYIAQGKPQSALQLAEILAMDPSEVPAYLEGQGLERRDETLDATWTLDHVDHAYSSWGDSDGSGALAKTIEDTGTGATFADGFASYFGTGGSITLGVGTPVVFNDGPRTLASADDLAAGERQSFIELSTAFEEPLDEKSGEKLAAACGFASAPHFWTFSRADGEYGYSESQDVSVWTGAVTIDGVDSFWYIKQCSYRLYDSNSYCYLVDVGCTPLSEVVSLLFEESDLWQKHVGVTGIATPEDLANADSSQTALWFAQLLVQNTMDCQAAPYVNVVTGEPVTYKNSLQGTLS